MPAGRRSDYTPEIAEVLCRNIAEGKSLRETCAAKGMPSRESVRRWLIAHEDFRAQYARARDEQADHYADEIIEIADSADDASLARLRIDARKWKAAKLAPTRYGDKVMEEVTGPDGGPVVIRREIVDPKAG